MDIDEVALRPGDSSRLGEWPALTPLAAEYRKLFAAMATGSAKVSREDVQAFASKLGPADERSLREFSAFEFRQTAMKTLREATQPAELANAKGLIALLDRGELPQPLGGILRIDAGAVVTPAATKPWVR